MRVGMRLGGVLVRFGTALVSGFGMAARVGMVAFGVVGRRCAVVRGSRLMMASGLMMRLRRILVRGVFVGLGACSDMLLVGSALTCHNC